LTIALTAKPFLPALCTLFGLPFCVSLILLPKIIWILALLALPLPIGLSFLQRAHAASQTGVFTAGTRLPSNSNSTQCGGQLSGSWRVIFSIPQRTQVLVVLCGS
jgi:hypothetical protein